MRIYIADLGAYNEGVLKGDWLTLPSEEIEIDNLIDINTGHGKGDFAIHDWELPFCIGEYSDPYKINRVCELIERYNLTDGLIKHLEYAFGVELYKIEEHDLKGHLEEVYTIEANTDSDFAIEYFSSLYENDLNRLPWELTYSIDYNVVYEKLEMGLSISKDYSKNIYYYSYK